MKVNHAGVGGENLLEVAHGFEDHQKLAAQAFSTIQMETMRNDSIEGEC